MTTNNMNGNISPTPSSSETNMLSDNVHNTSYADALRKGQIASDSFIPNNNSEELNFNSELAYVSKLSKTDTETNDNLNEQGMSSDLESPDNRISDCSEITEEFSSCLENDSVSEHNHDLKDVSGISASSEDKGISEVLPSNEETVTSLSSTNVNKNSSENVEFSSELTSEESGSCEEDEEEEDSSDAVDITDVYPTSMKWKLRAKNQEFPETVTVLDAPAGGKVYLVGTAHFSLESQEDVAKTIRATHPDVVMVELCKSRVNILSLDEATVLEESKNMNLEKIRAAIKQHGFMQGVLHLLLLNMSANLTKQLGMPPGGEFRRAFTEAKKVPGCTLHLGDRSIYITLERALAKLSLWKKIKVGWYMLASREPISKQDVERCKQKDLLEETLADMTGEFPELSKVFLEERDIFLTYSLQMASLPMPSHASANECIPTVVVGVVGIGHVPGIVEHWGKVTERDILPLISIPKPTTSSIVIRKILRYSMYGIMLYGGYRLVPKVVFKKPMTLIRSFLHF